MNYKNNEMCCVLVAERDFTLLEHKLKQKIMISNLREYVLMISVVFYVKFFFFLSY